MLKDTKQCEPHKWALYCSAVQTVCMQWNKANLLNVMKCKQAIWMAMNTKWAKLLVSVIWIRFWYSNSPLKSDPTDLATSWAPGWTEPYWYNVGKIYVESSKDIKHSW